MTTESLEENPAPKLIKEIKQVVPGIITNRKGIGYELNAKAVSG